MLMDSGFLRYLSVVDIHAYEYSYKYDLLSKYIETQGDKDHINVTGPLQGERTNSG